MNRFATHLKSFAADERGTTIIEYCLIASLISIVIVAGATQVGQSVISMFQKVGAPLQ